MTYYKHIISLGWNCTPAIQIRRAFKIEKAHFFDWLGLPLDSLVVLLKKGPLTLFEKDKIEVVEQSMEFVHCVHKSLNVPIYHDFKEKDLSDFDNVLSKYRFLKTRWDETLADGNILFVRFGDNEDGVVLRDTLREIYPNLDFHLLVLSRTPTEAEEGITFKHDAFDPPCPGNNDVWDRLLSDYALA